MPTLTIDSRPVTVADGATLLDAARALGLDVPALCRGPDGCRPNTSCLTCVMKVNGSPRLVPSCATAATDGLVVESETPEVRTARKMALELLLADHAGDCRGPCANVCPARMDIPTMIGHIEAGRLHEALVVVKEHIALPAVLGRICPELCEKGCRRAQVDSPVSICLLKRHVADVDLALERPWLPECPPDTGKSVAIVGSGAAGLAAAWYLRQMGHACVLLDANAEPGGNLRYAVDPAKLPHDVLDAEIDLIRQLGARFQQHTRVGKDVSLAELRQQFQAVLLAVGELDAPRAQALGAALAGKGLKVDRETFQTPLPGVFAAGGSVMPTRHAVRAVADGRTAALMIGQYFAGRLPAAGSKFVVRLGTISEAELSTFMQHVSPVPRISPPEGLSAPAARAESARCLHCECAKQYNCDLRDYALVYDASAATFKLPRRPFERQEAHGIVHEPGKCIACGICVQIAAQAKEPLGLTFIGRGFDVRVAAPFNAELSEALQKVARQCADACPTGALARARRQEE